MKKVLPVILLVLLSCQISLAAWTAMTALPAAARWGGVSFSLNGYGYYGLGTSDPVFFQVFYQDLWKYDPIGNSWTQMANFPLAARGFCASFSSATKGYVVGGYGAGPAYFNDTYEYDPVGNSWNVKANFTGGRRMMAAFALGSYGYVGTGHDGGVKKKDIWRYDPAGDSWAQMADYPDVRQDMEYGFAAGSYGYMGCGMDNSGSHVKTMSRYDPAGNTWTAFGTVPDFPGTARWGSAAFSSCGYGWIGIGADGNGTGPADFYKYNPNTNSWSLDPSAYPLTGVADASPFVINNIIYIAAGNGDAGKTNAMYSLTCTLLPVELTSFTAECKSGEVICNWSTASEINNDYFSIEKSVDGLNWNEIGNVKGAGNSSIQKNYEFVDESLLANQKIYYRLKQTDYDGKYEYHGPVSVICSSSHKWNLVLQNVPAANELDGTFFSNEDENVSLDICDLQGRKIRTEQLYVINGSNMIKVNLKEIQNGIYFVKISDDKREIVKKIVKL